MGRRCFFDIISYQREIELMMALAEEKNMLMTLSEFCARLKLKKVEYLIRKLAN